MLKDWIMKLTLNRILSVTAVILSTTAFAVVMTGRTSGVPVNQPGMRRVDTASSNPVLTFACNANSSQGYFTVTATNRNHQGVYVTSVDVDFIDSQGDVIGSTPELELDNDQAWYVGGNEMRIAVTNLSDGATACNIANWAGGYSQ
jgi:hypothetical protein